VISQRRDSRHDNYRLSTSYLVQNELESFCYGAKFATDANDSGLISVSVICHPSFANVYSYKKVKGPILFNCAETDDMFTDEIREKVKAQMDADSKAPPHDFKVFEK
jgi:dienelactone hydrolase